MLRARVEDSAYADSFAICVCRPRRCHARPWLDRLAQVAVGEGAFNSHRVSIAEKDIASSLAGFFRISLAAMQVAEAVLF